MQKTQRAAVAAANAKQRRTCCNCWHIKYGTIILGLLELVAIALILSGIIKQLINKNQRFHCEKEFLFRLFRHCHKWDFSTFDWTLAGDYFITLLLFTIAVCVLLLFLGIMKKSPYLLLPHLLIQGIFLVSSLAYFFLYAWSYFYIDLYKQKKYFRVITFLERMWLATLLLILAAFQLYIFFTVIKCCLYLQDHRNKRLRRIRQFEECIKRVRDAKQNGLWRSTSWGGGFQQYIGEYDHNNRKSKKRNKPVAHVQWNLQANVEKSISTSGIDDQSDSTIDSLAKTREQEKKLTDDVKNASSKVNNGCSTANASRSENTPRRSQVVEHSTTPAVVILSKSNKEKCEKNLKAIPVQSTKPTITNTNTNTTKRKVSLPDNATVLHNEMEQRSRSSEIKNGSVTKGAMPPYYSNVKRISISSTTPPLLRSPPQLHSILH